jgi:hypothetical protein
VWLMWLLKNYLAQCFIVQAHLFILVFFCSHASCPYFSLPYLPLSHLGSLIFKSHWGSVVYVLWLFEFIRGIRLAYWGTHNLTIFGQEVSWKCQLLDFQDWTPRAWCVFILENKLCATLERTPQTQYKSTRIVVIA